MRTVTILGVKIHAIDENEAIQTIYRYIASSKSHVVFTPGPEFLVRASKDSKFRDVLNSADLSLPDGTGLILASNGTIRNRVTGSDVTFRLLQEIQKTRYTVGIVITEHGLSEKSEIQQAVGRAFPDLKYKIFVYPEDVKSLEAGAPDILFVALGSPFQEMWIYEQKSRIPQIKVFMGVGGTFDFLTGRLPRAPQWIRKIGLEWMWRLSLQPRRFQRIFNAVIIFPFLVLVSAFRRRI